jgi:hypothetical protein
MMMSRCNAVLDLGSEACYLITLKGDLDQVTGLTCQGCRDSTMLALLPSSATCHLGWGQTDLSVEGFSQLVTDKILTSAS